MNTAITPKTNANEIATLIKDFVESETRRKVSKHKALNLASQILGVASYDALCALTSLSPSDESDLFTRSFDFHPLTLRVNATSEGFCGPVDVLVTPEVYDKWLKAYRISKTEGVWTNVDITDFYDTSSRETVYVSSNVGSDGWIYIEVKSYDKYSSYDCFVYGGLSFTTLNNLIECPRQWNPDSCFPHGEDENTFCVMDKNAKDNLTDFVESVAGIECPDFEENLAKKKIPTDWDIPISYVK